MPTVEFKDVKFELDKSGYLNDPKTWSKEVSEYIADKEGITLTEDHWKIIEAARKFYDKYNCDEMHLMACKDAGLEEGCIKRLFGGSIRQFEKVAGIEITWASS
ncbi:MAG TPA: TusE/DsrC/DsvC family sulfur relay protein [Nitrospirae bacterium]|nr:sulfurtransferase TusE [bacterium BMS3Abin09]GBE40158.1 sulfurtransferase TusE [bacterium BMS3Bbin09]HDH10848.1 TusE/DsrC/DsvC family sulfur relay protein [Nitrospirota bacterium]